MCRITVCRETGNPYDIDLLKDFPSKVNLIPFNSFPGSDYQRSSNNRIHNFQRVVAASGITATIRKTRGDDIDAACGQLVGGVKDKTTRQAKFQAKFNIKKLQQEFTKS